MGLKDVFEKFSGGGGAGWFHLSNDGDSAIVRFLYRGEEDLDYTVVHNVEIDGNKRKVECKQFKGEDCPLCKAGYKNRARMFLQLIDYSDDKKVKVWERGKTFLPEIMTFIDTAEPIYTIRAQITRHGEKGDPQTQYKIQPLINDDAEQKLEDNEENMEKIKEKRTDIVGKNNKVIELTKEEMRQFINGNFTLKKGDNDNGNPVNNSGNKKNNSSGGNTNVF